MNQSQCITQAETLLHKTIFHVFHPLTIARKMALKHRLHHIIHTQHINKIHVGCGYENFPKEWLNIGLFEEKNIPYAQVKTINDAYVLHFDLTRVLPIDQGSIQYIYGSHFLEHIPFEEAVTLLKSLHTWLKPDGIIRLAVPDLKLWIQKYYKNDEKFFRDFYSLIRSFPNLKTKGEIFAGQLFGYGHHWAYDHESIQNLLQRTGLTNVRRKKYGDSQIFKLGVVEPDTNIRKIESLCVEAFK